MMFKEKKLLPVLYTERLRLRKMYVGDSEDMFEYAKREDVTKYLLWSPHQSRDITLSYLSSIQKNYRKGKMFDWAVVLKDTNKMIGTCGFAKIDLDNLCGEVGYVINPEYQRKGYATEALSEIIRFGFDELKFERIEARYMTENVISRHVMEKCGMKYEGTLRSAMLVKEKFRDIGICSILKKEYNRVK